MPATITKAVTGLKWGSMKNTARPAVAMTTREEMSTNSLGWGRRSSKAAKNGSIAATMTQMEIK